jgi:hypothetical protein
MSEHRYHYCIDEACWICLNDHLSCEVCDGANQSLPTECPGTPLTDDQLVAISEGEIDFRNGSWTLHQRKSRAFPDVRPSDLDLPASERAILRHAGRARKMVPNPPSWVTDEAAWEAAKTQVQKHWDDYAEPWAVVAYVYRQMTN